MEEKILFREIKKFLEPTKNKICILNNPEIFKNLKVMNIKIKTVKILNKFIHPKNKILYLGKQHNEKLKKCPKTKYYFKGLGICCE